MSTITSVTGASAQQQVSSSQPDETNSEPLDLPVYLIYSKLSLPNLDNILREHGDVGFLRIVYDNEGKETDRTIAILPDAAYESLCYNGYGVSKQDGPTYGKGLRIARYELRDSNYPGEGRTKSLFVPVPRSIGSDDNQVIATVVDKLKHLAEWLIIDNDSWSINVPLKSREKGGVRSGCFISFKREISLERIAMVRILLTDTYWPEQSDSEERPIFKCYWARDRKERFEKSENDNANKEVSADELKKLKEQKKKEAIQKAVSAARPQVKKAPTVPISSQPTLTSD